MLSVSRAPKAIMQSRTKLQLHLDKLNQNSIFKDNSSVEQAYTGPTSKKLPTRLDVITKLFIEQQVERDETLKKQRELTEARGSAEPTDRRVV